MARGWRNRLRDFRSRRRDFSRLAFRFFPRHEEGRLGAGLASGAFALARGRLAFRCGLRSNGRRPRGGAVGGTSFWCGGGGRAGGGKAWRRGRSGAGWFFLWLGRERGFGG